MKISGSEKSGLFILLKSWLGQAPRYGWDYMEMKGKKALITVDHQPSRTKPGAVYAVIASISPLPEGYGEQAPLAPAKPTVGEAVPSSAASVDDADDEVPF